MRAEEMLKYVTEKIEKTSERIKSSLPHYSIDGQYNDQTEDKPQSWVNGFWPGILWLMYEYSGNEKYKKWANECEEKLESPLVNYQTDHDAGFVYGLSSVKNYEITGNEKSKTRALRAASALSSRLNLAGNFIRAWHGEGHEGWAIIDCMMNLPLLYWASEELKDPRFKYVAMRHADMAMKEFVKEDGSVNHIVMFDPITGERIGVRGGQGYGENSSWGRGTSWALHGFALSWFWTKEEKYLKVADRVAEFFMNNLPEDGVSPADFKVPEGVDAKRDASASCIAASGLALLYKQTGDEKYKKYAMTLLEGIFSHCLGDENEEAVTIHSNVYYHAEDYAKDVSLIYADYYLLEALIRLCK